MSPLNEEKFENRESLKEDAEGKEAREETDPVTVGRVESRDQVYETLVDLTPEQRQIVEDLKAAKQAQNWSEILAKYADQYHIEDLISLIPVLGDGATNVICGLILIYHAKNAGLNWKSYAKIILLQLADFGTGVIPIFGDIADFKFKPNEWSTYEFIKRTEELCKKAREAGIPEEEIRILMGAAEEDKKRNDKIAKVGGGISTFAGKALKKRKAAEA